MSGRDWSKEHTRSQAERRRRDPDSTFVPVLAGPGCWCGQPWPHDWPGKENNLPHPR